MADGKSGGSRVTVLLALAANLGIAVAKTVVAVISGSSSMAAEAAHSAVDTINEVLLLAGLRRSMRSADRRHPFGYGRERFFWSLLTAVMIFGAGALFAFLEGVGTIIGGQSDQPDPLLAYVVLAFAFVLEGVSWVQAVRQMRAEAREERRPFLEHIWKTDDPAAKSVLLEDTAALLGLLFAFGGVGLHQLTGSAVWDGVGSLLIGVTLTLVAFVLGRTNQELLIGTQADPRMVRAIGAMLRQQPEVEAVVDLVTLTTGTDQVLVCARLDFRDSLNAGDLELACVRIDEELRERWPDVREVFLAPVPRTDPEVRARVVSRYGRAVDGRPSIDGPAPDAAAGRGQGG